MKRPTDSELAQMTYEDASAWLEQSVYDVCLFIERLENAGKVGGNGHHAAQHIAAFAKSVLSERWDLEAEKKMLAKDTMDFVREKFPETKKL